MGLKNEENSTGEICYKLRNEIGCLDLEQQRGSGKYAVSLPASFVGVASVLSRSAC